MKKISLNKKQLAALLSKVQAFENPNAFLEQYSTDAEIAAEVLWYAYQQGDIQGKIIADLGCGTGIFGLGSLVLGAKKVFMVDLDQDALKIAKENLKLIEKETGKKYAPKFILTNVKDFKQKINVVIQNPPFGVRKTHQDKLFLMKAMEMAKSVYTFHKLSTENFVNRIIEENGFEIKNMLKYKFPLKRAFWFHTESVRMVDVGCWHIAKK